jgi:succinate-acetate transporter protein
MGWSHIPNQRRVTPASKISDFRGIFFFTGPVLLLLTTIFEWIMGNFFPMMVCGLFAVFWLSFGVLNLPEWQIAASYSTTGNAAEGAASVGYNAGIALYLIVWGFALFTFFFFTLKTNVVFALIFFLVDVGSWLLSAAYWKVASGDFDLALKLQKVNSLLHYLTIRLVEASSLLLGSWAGI